MKNIYTLINKDIENKIEYFSYSNINWVWFYPIKYNYWSTDDYYDEGIERESKPFRIHKDSDKLNQYLKHSIDVDRIRSLRTDVAYVAFTPTPF